MAGIGAAGIGAAAGGAAAGGGRSPVRVLGVGGSLRSGSSAERALRACLAAAGRAGAVPVLISGEDLRLPPYDPAEPDRAAAAARLITEVERADGLIVASPGYHGSISGLVKNVLDYLEDLRDHPRPYLEGRAVGCVAVAGGSQGAVQALSALRACVHALRGWPTPLGATVDTSRVRLDADGRCEDAQVADQLAAVGRQVVEFALMRRAWSDSLARIPGGVVPGGGGAGGGA